ncbi:hypothetical protein [Psychroserpens damuponensis]|uniref:hypothetical protein n=1 Tax=Psychroserpens damuponensis TaxID=943936 RepID=UPI000591747F|nr:hypothetical protein [Psychroserpens damuponensis]
MWFKKQKNIDLFNHPLISKLDANVAGLLNINVISTNLEKLKQFHKEEIKQSGIAPNDIVLLYEKHNEDLIKFICYTYHQELKFEENNTRPNQQDSKTLGLSKAFSITYAIYYFFLKNDKKQLSKYLSKRRIPQYEKFNQRLQQYDTLSKGVMFADSYIQYAGGYNKEHVNSSDITKALDDIKKMDEEHGAFWIAMLIEDEEFIIEVDKGLNLSFIFGDEEFQYKSQDRNETKSILELHINKEFDNIKSIVKK